MRYPKINYKTHDFEQTLEKSATCVGLNIFIYKVPFGGNIKKFNN